MLLYIEMSNSYLNINMGKRHWQPTPVLLPGKSHGWRSLVGCSHGVAKSRTRLSDFTFPFHLHALEKEMATHSSVLAWRVPRMGEPGGLLSKGSHRVGYDWSNLAAAVAYKNEHNEVFIDGNHSLNACIACIIVKGFNNNFGLWICIGKGQ